VGRTGAEPDPAILAPRLGRRTEEAFAYALAIHGAQVRKMVPIPYVGHLLAVASIVLEDGGDETQAVAALLHDAAEDQGGEARLADIRARFGSEVARIVEAMSDSLVADPADKAPWRERKEAYLARLRREDDPGALRVALADKLHNARSIVTDVTADPAAWTRFKASPDDTAWYYGTCVEILAARMPRSRFVAELDLTVARLAALVDAELARRAASD
jgi:(p)ppGpp synthase/HD superfamily hydrolase